MGQSDSTASGGRQAPATGVWTVLAQQVKDHNGELGQRALA